MDAFGQPTQGGRSRRATLVAAGTVVGVAFLVVVIALVVRARRGVTVDAENAARVEAQLERSVGDCAREADPAACREARVRAAASATGAAGLCEHLDGEARDECAWTVARERADAGACAVIGDEGKRARCADAILLAAALAVSDAGACGLVSDAEKRAGCLATVAGPITVANCAERADAAYCEALDRYEAARSAQNPDLCEEVANVNLRARCMDVVSPGDRDFDGLDANQEQRYGSSDTNADTDGDGYADAAEVANGYDPNGSGRLGE